MSVALKKREEVRKKRAFRVRKKLRGSGSTPRMSVIKSNKHIHVQIIDDEAGHTLASTGTLAKEFRNTEFNKRNKASARKIGERIAEIAKAKEIKAVIFDRGPFKYHGVLAELADAARAGGLQF